ncbi:hypothetical protein CkaCkLH20_07388 [Colletotrichum karsti]|uniref:Heterokaryon incompatibility protein 6, OR allele n=1 Tax=Colletotrichum karsti TaxID=1095194 RepID=A0A9P6I3J7_9PEZI|nr:uncharacterized protein CkaCkLH20_07388 [Colletotrichum karsti]KAF9875122.1 hypothetical protein CkaCkLH20_07388 [Colletotrichum karsti]
MELEGKSGHIWLEWYFVLMHSMKMEATDPKDLVYGLLGVSQLDIKPNYRRDVSVGDVYTEYVSRWLADPRSRSSEVSEPLEFLNDSGSAVAAPGFPSWVPNFEAFSQSRHRRRLSPLAGTVKKGLVTLGSFKTERFPTAAGAKLFGVGYELENVASVSGWSIGQGRTNGELLNFLASNHATSRCGIPFLGVWMRLMILETDLEVSHNTARLAFYLLHDLVSQNESPELSADQITVQLGRTYHSPDEIEPWEAWILRSFLYRVDTDATTPDSGTINLPHKDEDMEAAAQMRLEETYGSLQDYHIFETEGGRVGVAPDGVEVGDPVCILQGCGLPLILKRKNGGNCEESEYIHFSTSLIVGLMDGEAAGIIEEKKLEPKTIIIV